MQKREKTITSHQVQFLLCLYTYGLAAVELQASNISLVISLGGGSEIALKQVRMTEKKLREQDEEGKRYVNVEGWMKKEV